MKKKIYYKNLLPIAIILLLANVNMNAADESTAPSKRIVRAGFIKNAGQVYDMDGKLCPQVLYSLNLNNMSVFVTQTGITYGMVRFKDNPEVKKGYTKFDSKKDEVLVSDVARMDMNLLNSSIKKENCIEEKIDETHGVVNYYAKGLDESALNLHYVTRLRVQNIYPGIDWILNVDPEKGLKVDYILQPGANVSDIKMEFNGKKNISLINNGEDVNITTPLESFNLGKLICFSTDKKSIQAKYKLINENEVIIETKDYDASLGLIIDPTIQLQRMWGTYFGGNSMDNIYADKIDLVKNVFYFAGKTNAVSTSFPPLLALAGASNFANTIGGLGYDAFICQTTLQGENQWCSYIFSTDNDAAFDVTVDHSGNTYLVGMTSSNTGNTIQFPTTAFYTGGIPGFLQKVNNCSGAPDDDGFICKFDPQDKLVWCTIFGNNLNCGTTSDDDVFGVTCDGSDNVYVCGISSNQIGVPNNFPFFPGIYNFNSYLGVVTGFVAEFNSITQPIWSTYIPTQQATGISYDNATKNLFVCGFTNTNNMPFTSFTTGLYPSAALLPDHPGTFESTLFAFSGTDFIWGTFIGSDGGDQATACDVSEYDDKIYVSGYTYSSNGNPSPTGFPWAGANNYFDNNYQITGAPNAECHGWIASFYKDFKQEWFTLFAGNGIDQAISVSSNIGGSVFLTGHNQAPVGTSVFPLVDPGSPFYKDQYTAPANPLTVPITYFSEPYIAMFIPGQYGNKLNWCTYYGEDLDDEYSTDIEANGQYLLWTGYAFTKNAQTGLNLFEPPNSIHYASNAFSRDGIIAKFDEINGYNLKQTDSSGEPIPENKDFVIWDNSIKKFLFQLNTNNKDNSILSVELYDFLGKKSNLIYDNEKSHVVLNLNFLASGLYSITVNTKKSSIVYKISVVK